MFKKVLTSGVTQYISSRHASYWEKLRYTLSKSKLLVYVKNTYDLDAVQVLILVFNVLSSDSRPVHHR